MYVVGSEYAKSAREFAYESFR